MAKIGIFDSGEGGLSVLREIVRLLPDEQYIYYSDNAFCPYGDKTADYIISRCREITELLLSKGAGIIVVACNTATAAAISTLREEYSDRSNPNVRHKVLSLTDGRTDHVMFIGMEPAVKPAALGTRSGVIGVLATAGTLKGSKYLTTKGNYEEGCKIVEHVGKGFVELVENGELSGEKAEKTVRESLIPLLDEGADTIVLGCTHYPFLLDTMKKVAGEGVKFIDPAPAVARHLIYVMVQEGLLGEGKATKALSAVIRLAEEEALGHGTKNAGLLPEPDIELISSGELEPLERIFHLIFG
ncbi:MAG: glutamate racemase [Bacteroidales bacterium]|nr:glutamate racemase [Bacteroidales bacterium]